VLSVALVPQGITIAFGWGVLAALAAVFAAGKLLRSVRQVGGG